MEEELNKSQEALSNKNVGNVMKGAVFDKYLDGKIRKKKGHMHKHLTLKEEQ